MLKRLNLIAIALFSILSISALALAEEKLTITTYYPSPYGSYNELRTKQLAVGEGYQSSAVSIPDNSLIVQDNVGIGTNTPMVKLGRSGFLDAQDVWVRDANSGNGAWMSELPGGIKFYGIQPSDEYLPDIDDTCQSVSFTGPATEDKNAQGVIFNLSKLEVCGDLTIGLYGNPSCAKFLGTVFGRATNGSSTGSFGDFVILPLVHVDAIHKGFWLKREVGSCPSGHVRVHKIAYIE